MHGGVRSGGDSWQELAAEDSFHCYGGVILLCKEKTSKGRGKRRFRDTGKGLVIGCEPTIQSPVVAGKSFLMGWGPPGKVPRSEIGDTRLKKTSVPEKAFEKKKSDCPGRHRVSPAQSRKMQGLGAPKMISGKGKD